LNRQTGRSRGFGFVEMSTDQAAADAMKALNSQQIAGRKLQVSFSEQRDQRSTAYGIY
jgi:RNA recognition motif-containing protein